MRARRRLPLCLLILAALGGCATWIDPGDDRAFEVSAAWIKGRAAVAWYGGHLAHEAVFLRFADTRGRPQGLPLLLTDATRDAFEPSLQELDGDALVAWYEQAPAGQGDPPPQVALLARFDAEGRRVWQRQLSADDSRGRIPVVRVAGTVIHAAWIEQRNDQLPVLRVARLDGQGNWLGAPRDAVRASNNTWNLNAAVDANGALHVVFDSDSPGRAKELQWVIARPSGIEHVLSPDDGRNSVFPDIALDGSRYAITWVDSRDGNDEVYLRCDELGDSGAPGNGLASMDARTRRVTRTATQSMGAYAAWHEKGLELAWIEVHGERRELWRQSFDRDCRPRSVPARVQTAGWQAGIASLASSPAGLALAWNGMRGPVSVVRLKVWPRAFSPSAAAR
jgi:hypothetical protein